MKPIYFALVFLLVALQYQLWFTDGGLRDLNQLQQDLLIKQQENTGLRAQNYKLTHQIYDLKNSAEEIGSYARQEHNMVGQGEIYYQIVE